MSADDLLLAFDLGTGGNKASLYEVSGACRAEAFVPYETLYPGHGRHEQRPEDWWRAVVDSTRTLFAGRPDDRRAVRAIGISGHSLGVVPLDGSNRLLRESVPIWSDSRPTAEETGPFFGRVAEADWYRKTGSGFPPPLYSIFKLIWLRRHEPERFGRIRKILGTKDYVNHRLTGSLATDFSYASGSGVYDLKGWRYDDALIDAAGIPRGILAEPVASTEVLGTLTAEAAAALELPREVKVVAGGVDNSCMALGARAFREGRVYNSLGSSSWIAVSSAEPLLDVETRPYVFAHVVPGLFASATAIFSAGTSLRWVRDVLCADLAEQAKREGADVYDKMTALAGQSPAGANGLIFNPSLAGGSSLDADPRIRGAWLGLDLKHTRADLVRAALEGIACGLRVALDALRKLTPVDDTLLVVGGGSRSALWRQIFADAYNVKVIKTRVDQQAAALGAAALAAVGCGLWNNFDRIDAAHTVEVEHAPVVAQRTVYEARLPAYRKAMNLLAELGAMADG